MRDSLLVLDQPKGRRKGGGVWGRGGGTAALGSREVSPVVFGVCLFDDSAADRRFAIERWSSV